MSENRSRVTVHSKLTWVSSKPLGGKPHELSALDHAMALHTVHVIFYYRANPFERGLFDSDFSLSDLLCMYPPVMGRLARGDGGNWVVKCNDAGVRTLRASVGTTLDEWLRSADASEERDLTVWEDMPGDPIGCPALVFEGLMGTWLDELAIAMLGGRMGLSYVGSGAGAWIGRMDAVLGGRMDAVLVGRRGAVLVMLNEFEGGGLAIGLSCPHMLADPTCATLFFKSWTETNRGEPVCHPPIYHLPALNARRSLSTGINSIKYLETKSKSAESPSGKMATATFRLSHSIIKQCLAQIHDECPDATPFDLLAALFWIRIMRLKMPRHDQKHSLSICVDVRKPIHGPIPYGYFGNALHFSLLSMDAELLDTAGLGHVAGAVHRHVADLHEEELLSAMNWFESRKGENGQYAQPFMMYGPELTCISMEHMITPEGSTCESSMYEAAFRKGEEPVHMTYRIGNVEGEGLIMVMPSPEAGLARTVTVTLSEEQLAELCEDQAIMDLQPTMLLGGKM
ncbi:hypothetical protein RJ639_011777 [Escallonia herrerae]|uniref:Acyltransferase n=1 Tax=Escallonia herrerae TaxID=1293975 RepID=A0AA89APD3_9ASTE|nr:hypothetical protein RJ639_011777 [Escallonia herrerae]